VLKKHLALLTGKWKQAAEGQEIHSTSCTRWTGGEVFLLASRDQKGCKENRKKKRHIVKNAGVLYVICGFLPS